MNIGIDISDTICNAIEVLTSFGYRYNRELGNELPPALDSHEFRLENRFNWSMSTLEQFWATYQNESLAHLRPRPLVRETLNQLRREHHRLIFITARYYADEISISVSKQWLKDHHFRYDELVFNCDAQKGHYLQKNLDVFISDDVNSCLLFNNLGIHTLVYDNLWNQTLQHPQIKRVYCWPQIYEIVTELASDASQLNSQRSRRQGQAKKLTEYLKTR
jgi:uncharacterized HAD superfamily protein